MISQRRNQPIDCRCRVASPVKAGSFNGQIKSELPP
jgi:hypothetical protein